MQLSSHSTNGNSTNGHENGSDNSVAGGLALGDLQVGKLSISALVINPYVINIDCKPIILIYLHSNYRRRYRGVVFVFQLGGFVILLIAWIEVTAGYQ